MGKPDPYTRSFWRFADEYPDIYADDHAYALWSRLRDMGDMAWPAAASLPLRTNRKALEMLVAAGLVALQAGDRYRIRGMDKHREQRAEAGRKGADARWGRLLPDSDGNANGERPHYDRSATEMPERREEKGEKEEERKTEPIARARLDTQREGLPHLGAEAEDALTAASGLVLSTASDRVLTDLDGLVERHGFERVGQTIGRIRSQANVAQTWPQFVYGARNKLEPIPKADAQAEQEADREEAEKRRWQRSMEANRRRRAEVLGQ